mmetsp:Transcript_10476/g.17825  ORF Transcript_10476/g.17825 Transcript_10476/m.17825 type:complete len:231 (+) Transcript_10476:1097-1789(+)
MSCSGGPAAPGTSAEASKQGYIPLFPSSSIRPVGLTIFSSCLRFVLFFLFRFTKPYIAFVPGGGRGDSYTTSDANNDLRTAENITSGIVLTTLQSRLYQLTLPLPLDSDPLSESSLKPKKSPSSALNAIVSISPDPPLVTADDITYNGCRLSLARKASISKGLKPCVSSIIPSRTKVRFIPGRRLRYCRIAEAKSKASSAGRRARPKRRTPNESGFETVLCAKEFTPDMR